MTLQRGAAHVFDAAVSDNLGDYKPQRPRVRDECNMAAPAMLPNCFDYLLRAGFGSDSLKSALLYRRGVT
jgi:hypothetical protein